MGGRGSGVPGPGPPTGSQPTRETRRRYDRIAPIYDLMEGAIERLLYRRWRRRLWSEVRGEVLEIGVGTGANFEHHPRGASVVGIDLSPRMLDRAARRAVRGLREARRVLRPGGRLLLLEHVRSSVPWLGRLMGVLNPIAVRLTGANIDRDTVANVERAGFEMDRVETLSPAGIYKLILVTS